jgi:Ni,Fe-hydrogenase III large subunit
MTLDIELDQRFESVAQVDRRAHTELTAVGVAGRTSGV